MNRQSIPNGRWIESRRMYTGYYYTYMYRTILPYYVRITKHQYGAYTIYVEYAPNSGRCVTVHSSASKSLLSAKHVARDAIRRHRKAQFEKRSLARTKNQPSRRVTGRVGAKKVRV